MDFGCSRGRFGKNNQHSGDDSFVHTDPLKLMERYGKSLISDNRKRQPPPRAGRLLCDLIITAGGCGLREQQIALG